MKKYLVASDPRGLIFEAYRIDNINNEDCRSIFFDWALGLDASLDAIDELRKVYNIYSEGNPDHPMTLVLKEGLTDFKNSRKRGRRKKTRVNWL